VLGLKEKKYYPKYLILDLIWFTVLTTLYFVLPHLYPNNKAVSILKDIAFLSVLVILGYKNFIKKD